MIHLDVNKFKTRNGLPFGAIIDIDDDLPKDCDAIMLGHSTGKGWQLDSALLPHQLYTRVVKELIQKLTIQGYKEIDLIVIPVRTKEYIHLNDVYVRDQI